VEEHNWADKVVGKGKVEDSSSVAENSLGIAEDSMGIAEDSLAIVEDNWAMVEEAVACRKMKGSKQAIGPFVAWSHCWMA